MPGHSLYHSCCTLASMRVITHLVLLFLLATPTSLASWSVKGSLEPSTRRDATEGWMFLQPDVSPSAAVNKVYFNGFTSYCAPPYGVGCQATSFSPNLALAGTNVLAFPTVTVAMLGVWKDCNQDGYVGFGDQGLVEYRADLLFDKSVCPASATPIDPRTGLPPPDWFPTHNDGAWVREYLPIAWNPPSVTGDKNAWNINDNGARVWADWGLPGAPAQPDCYVATQPRGTFASTGGMLEWADCFDGGRVTDTFDSIATGRLAPYSFADAPRNQRNSTSALNVRDPWGRPGDASFAYVFDCSRPPMVQDTSVRSPRPRVAPSTSASPAGTVDELQAEATDCARDGPGSLGRAPYATEGDVVDITDARVRTDHSMFPVEDQRPSAPVAAVLGKATPKDLGVRATSLDGFWGSQDVTGVSHDPFVGRDSTFAAPTIMTYYAFISNAIVIRYGLQLNPSGSKIGTYGQEACGASTVGIQGGWNCDRTAWWPGNSGSPYDASVGDAYQLRDIDCYDESAAVTRGIGVTWSTISGYPCT